MDNQMFIDEAIECKVEELLLRRDLSKQLRQEFEMIDNLRINKK